MVYGSTTASFNVEDFGTEARPPPHEPEIDARLSGFEPLTHFSQPE